MSGPERSVQAFAPATVSNVGCGFDIFGFAVEGPGDRVTATRSREPGVVLRAVFGDGGALPRAAERNTAGVAAAQVLAAAGADGGLGLVLHKEMPLASGLGSSAASAVAAALAADAALRAGLPREVLLRCAVEAERMACGAAHGDNAAPCLYGGFVLVRKDLQVTPLPVPEDLFCALLRPHVAVDTGAARAGLPETVPIADAVEQWGNTAALVAALFRSDEQLLASAVRDRFAEPLRQGRVPAFEAMREAALGAGALACGLSGSGPTVFALCCGAEVARLVSRSMGQAFETSSTLTYDNFVSPVGTRGAYLLPEDSP